MPKTRRLPVRVDRLMADLETLARFGHLGDGNGINRPAYSPAYRQAADWLMEMMQDAGLAVRMDAAGNIIGRMGPGDGPAVVSGSHIDSVPAAGKFDGTLGVLAGLEVARCLVQDAVALRKAFEVIAFMDEEGAYLSELGARAMIGDLVPEELHYCSARDGTPLLEAMTRFGLDLENVTAATRPREDFDAYVELHIEQGPVLEDQGLDIGLVENIVGLQLTQLSFVGQANHAGTTPVPYRHDAFRAASEVAVKAFDILESDFGPDVRLTYGDAEVHPGAPNVVPGSTLLMQEIRASQQYTIDATYRMTMEVAESVGEKHGVALKTCLISRDAPARMSDRITDLVEKVCQKLRYSTLRMPSGAGHDAQVISRICDAGMIFVPSANGISHNPAEHTSISHIGAGAAVLFETIRTLVSQE